MSNYKFFQRWLVFFVAMTGWAVVPSSAAPVDASSDRSAKLEEIVVTAQKREESIQDVPISMSVLNTDSLVENNQLDISDYYSSVPGLSIAPTPQGGVNLGIRGIITNTNAGNGTAATTGVLIDDTPVGTGWYYVPDFDPGDLQRIEVLRGPQGTLYGTSSMGGLINYITQDPSTQRTTGRVEAGTSSVYNGADLGYSFRAAVNVPLTSDLAMRANVFTREDPGYLDNPILGINGINMDHASGGHVSLLWQPSDTLKIKLSALYQRVAGGSSNDITTSDTYTGQPLGDLQQGYIRGSTPYVHESQAYGAVVKYQIGDLQIASITGYNNIFRRDSFDLTPALGSVSQSYYGVGGWAIQYDYRQKSYSEELRFSGPLSRYFDGQLGLYYNWSECAHPCTAWPLATNPTTGAVAAAWGQLGGPDPQSMQDETAVFADVTYHATDRFDIQMGGRESRLRQFASTTVYSGPVVAALFQVNAPSLSSTSTPAEEYALTYLLSPQFKLTPDLMIYARLATGFRAGSTNEPLSPYAMSIGVPAIIEPDKTTNYEIGTKGDFLDHKLTLDASLYYINWQSVQLSLDAPNGSFVYGANAGAAKSEGIDLSIEARPAEGLKLSSWVAYDDAAFTTYPATAVSGDFYAAPGERLPYSAKWSGSASADQEFPLTGSLKGFVGISVAYVGGREGLFTNTSTRTYLPPYAKTDLRSGVTDGPWKVNLYANNVTNRRGVISGGAGNDDPQSFYLIQPRTIGVSVARSFE
jgi:iron complex outermembrane receptor protein